MLLIFLVFVQFWEDLGKFYDVINHMGDIIQKDFICTFIVVSFITFPIPSQNLWRGDGTPPRLEEPKNPSLNRVKSA